MAQVTTSLEWQRKCSSILDLFGPQVSGSAPAAEVEKKVKVEEEPGESQMISEDAGEPEFSGLAQLAATPAPVEWNGHQQNEEEKILAGLFSEKLTKDAATKEVLQRIDSLESTRVTLVTSLVVKKHDIERLITELRTAHPKTLVEQAAPGPAKRFRLYSQLVTGAHVQAKNPGKKALRMEYLEHLILECEKQKSQQHRRAKYIEALLTERHKEVQLEKEKIEFRKLVDEFTVLNYKVIAERIVGGLAKDILGEAKGHRDAEKNFKDWIHELEMADKIRLAEQWALAEEKNKVIMARMNEITRGILKDLGGKKYEHL